MSVNIWDSNEQKLLSVAGNVNLNDSIISEDSTWSSKKINDSLGSGGETRDFTKSPIDLSSEVTGNLPVENIDSPEFTELATRENIESKEKIPTLFGKIKKYFTDLKAHAFNDTANNLTTTEEGFALDARQGKELDDKIADKSKVVSLTRAEYDALTTKDADTYYIITDEHDVFSISDEWRLLAKVTLENTKNTIVTVDNVAGCKEFTIISKLVGYDTRTAHITVPNISLKDTIRNLLFEPMSSNAYFLTTATFTNDTTLCINQYIGSSWGGSVETKIYAR